MLHLTINQLRQIKMVESIFQGDESHVILYGGTIYRLTEQKHQLIMIYQAIPATLY